MKHVSLTIFAMMCVVIVYAQSPWSRSNVASVNEAALKGRTLPQKFQIFKLNQTSMEARLSQAPSEKSAGSAKSGFTIELPDVDGKLQTFTIVSAPVADPGLLRKLNGAQSFSGKSVTDPHTMVRFSISKLGLNAIINTPGKPTVYIRSIDSKNGMHIIFTDEGTSPETFECTTPAGAAKLLQSKGGLSNAAALKNANTGNIRVFRLAIAASGEFSNQYDNDPENDDGDAARINAVLAYQLVWVTDANFYLERDFGIRLQVIGTNNLIIYLDSGTDPFAGGDLNVETQAAIDGAIGSANYDIGHLMNYTPGGNAGNAGDIGSICKASTKGSGYTGRADWTAFTGYASIMFTHELGHQSGANHTFTHQDDNDNAQIEPGSGSTIMSYGGNGIADPQYVIGLRDKYFHAISIQQATDYVASVACGSTVSAGNNVPTADAGPDYTIPKSTAFILKGSASDADGDAMTFTWEQMDKLTAGDIPWTVSATNTKGPAFRSRVPSTSMDRTLPIDGISDPWEVLSSVERTFNFRFTVRDNRISGAQNNSDDVVITVGNAGPLNITFPNGGESLCPGDQTITWDVNGTDAAGLAPNVRILLSNDGGATYSIVVVASTPNDGAYTYNFPCTVNTAARLKIEAVDNIFFDINGGNFSYGDGTKPTFSVPGPITINKNATCGYDASVGITGDVSDENDNCSTGLNATFVDNESVGACVGESIITRTWTLTDNCGNSTVKLQTITVKDVTAPTFTVPPPITIYKDANCNHDASVAKTGDVTDEADNCDNTLNATFTDVETPGACIGNLTITRTWKLVDDCGNSTIKVQVITVKDILPPTISNISTNPSVLWPVNHKMIKVAVNYTAVDNCSAVTNVLTVSSNQPTDGLGDGTTATDWQVLNATTVMLRAERSGKLKTDRIYTITITSKDNCGNVSSAPAYVRVPHNQPLTRMAAETLFEVTSKLTVLATPNPSKSQFTLNIIGANDQEVSIRITDSYGRVIETRKGLFANSVVQLNKLQQAGLYFAEVTQGDSRKVVKLLKQ